MPLQPAPAGSTASPAAVSPAARLATAGWFVAGLAFVAGTIAFLELLYPYYFCQDDALVAELPLVLAHLRAAGRGQPYDYTPWILLGSPVPSIIATYPPLQFAHAIARDVLGDEHATFEVSAILHLLAGYGLTFHVARRLGIRPVLAALVGLTFVLSGPVLVMARCWFAFGSLAVFIPLLALFPDRLRRGPVGPGWPIGLAAALGAYYHAGFPQLFVLGCGLMLAHAAALAAWGLVPWRRLVWLAPALLLGAAIALPLFHRQWQLSQEVTLTDPGGGIGLEHNLPALVLPYPLARGSLPNFWDNVNPQWSGHFWYFGTVLLLAFAVAVFRAIRRWWFPASAPPPCGPAEAGLIPALAVPAVSSFLLALGEWGGLWWLMGLLPVGLRNNPFRALPWFVFFACLTGACFIDAFVSAPRSFGNAGSASRARRFLATTVLAGVALMALHVTRVGIAFYSYGFRPYPELPPRLAAVIAPDDRGIRHRIMSFAALRTTDPTLPFVLPLNLAVHAGVPAFHGYDPLVQRFGRYVDCATRVMADPRRALAAYGVRWIVIHRTVWGGWQPQTQNRFETVLAFQECLKPLLDAGLPEVDPAETGEFVRVVEIPEAAPLAFDAAAPTEPLPLRASTDGLEIGIPPGGPRRVVANFLRYPRIVATADGRPVDVSEDEWRRIVVDVPAGAGSVAIRYRPDHRAGLVAAAVAAAGGLAALAVAARHAR